MIPPTFQFRPTGLIYDSSTIRARTETRAINVIRTLFASSLFDAIAREIDITCKFPARVCMQLLAFKDKDNLTLNFETIASLLFREFRLDRLSRLLSRSNSTFWIGFPWQCCRIVVITRSIQLIRYYDSRCEDRLFASCSILIGGGVNIWELIWPRVA